MSEPLPDGWAVSKLDDIVSFALGGDWGKDIDETNDDLTEVRVIRGTEFKDWLSEKGASAAKRCIKPSSLEKRRLQKGDLILEVSGGGPSQPVGRTVVIDDEALARADAPLVCSNFFRLLRLSPEVEPSFIGYLLRFAYVRGKFNEFQTETTNLRNLNVTDFLEKTEVSIAPLAEQRRIVTKLETLLGKVNDCQQRLAKIPRLLKRFRQSVLAAACSGCLTADWREKNSRIEDASQLIAKVKLPRAARYQDASVRDDLELSELPVTWVWTNLRFLLSPSEAFCYGVVQPGENDPDGAFLIRAGDLNDGQVDTSALRRIPLSVHKDYKRSQLMGGEVLVTVVGAGIGEAAIAQPECAGFNIARAVAKLPVREFSASYVYRWLSTSRALHWMKGDSREVARPTLNLEQLQTLPVPLPPLAEQLEIVRRVEQLFAFADQVEARFATAQAHVDKLTQSLLAKAFRGELVPQDPKDEPASVLLARIRAEKNGATGAKRRKVVA